MLWLDYVFDWYQIGQDLGFRRYLFLPIFGRINDPFFSKVLAGVCGVDLKNVVKSALFTTTQKI